MADSFEMSECNPPSTSLDYNQQLSAGMYTKGEERNLSNIAYIQAIGICYVVSLLSWCGKPY